MPDRSSPTLANGRKTLRSPDLILSPGWLFLPAQNAMLQTCITLAETVSPCACEASRRRGSASAGSSISACVAEVAESFGWRMGGVRRPAPNNRQLQIGRQLSQGVTEAPTA